MEDDDGGGREVEENLHRDGLRVTTDFGSREKTDMEKTQERLEWDEQEDPVKLGTEEGLLRNWL